MISAILIELSKTANTHLGSIVTPLPLWSVSYTHLDVYKRQDHIGIVESVSNGIIHTIEGNSNNQVRRNTYRIGHGNIRGFATPRYQ